MGNMAGDYRLLPPAQQYAWMTGRMEGLNMTREQALAEMRARGINYTPDAPPTPPINPAVNLSQLFQNLLQALSQLQNSWSGVATHSQQPLPTSPYQNNPYQNNYQPAPYQPAPYQPVTPQVYPPVARKGGQGGYG